MHREENSRVFILATGQILIIAGPAVTNAGIFLTCLKGVSKCFDPCTGKNTICQDGLCDCAEGHYLRYFNSSFKRCQGEFLKYLNVCISTDK